MVIENTEKSGFFRFLFRLRPIMQVEMIRIPTIIYLFRFFYSDPSHPEKMQKSPVNDSSTALALYIITHQNESCILETLTPHLIFGNRRRHTIDETASRFKSRFSIRICSFITTCRKVIQYYLRSRISQHLCHINRSLSTLMNKKLPGLINYTVVRWPPLHHHIRFLQIGNLHSLIRLSTNRLMKSLPNLPLIHIKSSNKRHIPWSVSLYNRMH